MLWHQFLTNQGRVSNKWPHYFCVYEQHLRRFRNTSLVLWEIGIQNGGSLQLWKQYLGPFAVIVGIDIDPACAQCAEEQIHIRIGNQNDTAFLQNIINEFGPPDIVIDDGSHIMNDMKETFFHMYTQMPDNGVYIVEDLHTCYWPEFKGGLRAQGSFIEICKNLVDSLNAYHSQGRLKPTSFTDTTYSISFYDSMVVFEKKKRPKNLKAIITGTLFQENLRER